MLRINEVHETIQITPAEFSRMVGLLSIAQRERVVGALAAATVEPVLRRVLVEELEPCRECGDVDDSCDCRPM